MEGFVNELSFNEEMFDDYTNVSNLRDVYKGLVNNGINVCRIASEDRDLLDKLTRDNPSRKNLREFMFSFFQAPYEGNKDVELHEEEYYSYTWQCNGKECFGFAMSYIMDSIAVSIGDDWDHYVDVLRNEQLVRVRNASNMNHIGFHQEWFDSLKEITLLETDIPISDKRIHLRDDHGKDVLEEFAKKLCGSPYITEIINSLPFNRNSRKFVRRVGDDGIIELVLCWTDKGYGMAVQTTGRNLRETKKIAEILQQEYGR